MRDPGIDQTGLITSNAVGHSVAPLWRCRVESGADSGKEITVGSLARVIGADAGCDLVLSDPTVSRRHVEVRRTAEGILVKDLGSTNGTFLYNSRFQETMLQGATVLRVGQTELNVAPIDRPTLEPSARNAFGGMVGASLGMRELFAVLELASPTEANVLLEGESGTGKEVAARAIHENSHRREGPFVVVDCSALQENLVDSHLFGHLRGAFTDAVNDRKGAFAQAHGGTLFLDEIGELPLASQAKLLRVLEARTVQPVGSDQRIDIDVRVLAATNRNLSAMVKKSEFRFDLLQRLAVVHVCLPALRQRLEDLPVLVSAFYAKRGVEPGSVEGPNLEAMQRHAWPGNVRELRNVLERAWVLSGGSPAPFKELRLWLNPSTDMGGGGLEGLLDPKVPFNEAKQLWVDAFERRYLAALVRDTEGNLSEAARQSGINRNHIRKLLIKHGLYEGP